MEEKMHLLETFRSFPWCKSNWSVTEVDKDCKDQLTPCSALLSVESPDVLDIIKKSKEFPVPFPISTIRLEQLKERRPIHRLNKNIASTYPLIHERVLLLLTRFLTFKRQYGSTVERDLYKNMSVPNLIDRILLKRAITFIGPKDKYKLISGESGQDNWESIGTDQEISPLHLENCLSYDEIKLASLVYVSGYTECINDGARRNKGVVQEDIEDHAVIIGVIGPRFKRKNRMEYEDVVISEDQNIVLNGYGEKVRETLHPKDVWRKIWAEFYQISSFTYDELISKIKNSLKDKPEEVRHQDRYVKIPRSKKVFDNEVYYKRIRVTAECILLEAEARASESGRFAFLDVIGAGLGVWRATPHQNDVYVLTFLERVQALLHGDMLNHVSDVNIAYIHTGSHVLELFTNASGEPSQVKKLFLKSTTHPKGGINFQLESRNPSSKLTGPHSGKLLVMTYAWDGNAHPGNEFWIGKLDTSGDPAAACSTQVSELHNASINRGLRAGNTRVVGGKGLQTLQHFSRDIAA